MKRTAIILGATGLIGNILLQKLLADETYAMVKVFSRKPLDFTHPKLKVFTGDLLDLSFFSKDFTADEVFCCIGTTAKKTPDKTLYRKIDLGIPETAAKLCRTNAIHTFVVISSIGANSGSPVFYSKTKGEMEEAVLKEKIEHTYILRPSLIFGKRNEKRFAEMISSFTMRSLEFLFIGKLKKYRAIEAEKIASVMIGLAHKQPQITIVESDQIEKLYAMFDTGQN